MAGVRGLGRCHICSIVNVLKIFKKSLTQMLSIIRINLEYSKNDHDRVYFSCKFQSSVTGFELYDIVILKKWRKCSTAIKSSTLYLSWVKLIKS